MNYQSNYLLSWIWMPNFVVWAWMFSYSLVFHITPRILVFKQQLTSFGRIKLSGYIPWSCGYFLESYVLFGILWAIPSVVLWIPQLYSLNEIWCWECIILFLIVWHLVQNSEFCHTWCLHSETLFQVISKFFIGWSAIK